MTPERYPKSSASCGSIAVSISAILIGAFRFGGCERQFFARYSSFSRNRREFDPFCFLGGEQSPAFGLCICRFDASHFTSRGFSFGLGDSSSALKAAGPRRKPPCSRRKIRPSVLEKISSRQTCNSSQVWPPRSRAIGSSSGVLASPPTRKATSPLIKTLNWCRNALFQSKLRCFPSAKCILPVSPPLCVYGGILTIQPTNLIHHLK